MTSKFLQPDLERDEGRKSHAYLDNANPPNWTIGIGHKLGTLPMFSDWVWDDHTIDTQFLADVIVAKGGIQGAEPWFERLSDLRQDCLVNMTFNLGLHGLLGFHTFLRLMAQNKFDEAVLDLRDNTLWYHQVGHRGKRIYEQIRSNIHQE